jgi:hypothetical protein
MRAREIVQEDYNQSLESDLNNLLVGAQGFGAGEVNTQDIVNQLYQMGYSVSVNSLMPLLSRNPMVMNATPQMIKFVAPEGTGSSGGDADQDSASRVSDMASKATKIG